MGKILLLIAFVLSVFTASAQSNEVYISVNPTTLHADGADGFSPLGISAGYNRFIDLGCNDALKLAIGSKRLFVLTIERFLCRVFTIWRPHALA